LVHPTHLYTHTNTQRLLLLLDARHGLKQQDRAFLQRLYTPPSNESPSDSAYESAAVVVWDSDPDAAAPTATTTTTTTTEEEEEEEEEEEDAEGADAPGEEGEDAQEPPPPPPPPPMTPLPPFHPPKLQIVFTKCDLLPRDDLARRVLLVRRELEEGGVVDAELNLPRALVAGMPSLMVAAARGRKGLTELQVCGVCCGCGCGCG
jgi:hypothetical protein